MPTVHQNRLKFENFIPSTKGKPIKQRWEPNEVLQLHFGGPIYNKRNQEKHFVACIERFSKFPSVEVFKHANTNSIQKMSSVLHPATPGTAPHSLRSSSLSNWQANKQFL